MFVEEGSKRIILGHGGYQHEWDVVKIQNEDFLFLFSINTNNFVLQSFVGGACTRCQRLAVALPSY